MNKIERNKVLRHEDNRGSFREIWRLNSDPFLQVRQINLSVSKKNVLRGMHFHKNQHDIWHLTHGRAFVTLYDLRKPDGEITQFEMMPDDYVIIPPLVAHGFLALEDMELLYGVTNEYDGTDEWSFTFRDVPWPKGITPIVSERDLDSGPLINIKNALNRERTF